MGSPPVRGQGAGASGMTRISFPLAREKCGLDGRLLRSAKAKAGEGRVSKAAGGRVRSMYRARGVCDGPCAYRARDEVVAKTTAADFFADVSRAVHDTTQIRPPPLAVVLELNLGLRLKPKPDNLTRAPPTRALRSEHIGRRLDISATPWRGFTSIREVSRRRGAEGERRSMPKTFANNISATIFVEYPYEIEAPKRQPRRGSDLRSSPR